MNDHAQFKGIGPADIDEDLNGLILGFRFIFCFAFHFPGRGESGYLFHAVFFQAFAYFLFGILADIFQFGGNQDIVKLTQDVPP